MKLLVMCTVIHKVILLCGHEPALVVSFQGFIFVFLPRILRIQKWQEVIEYYRFMCLQFFYRRKVF